MENSMAAHKQQGELTDQQQEGSKDWCLDYKDKSKCNNAKGCMWYSPLGMCTIADLPMPEIFGPKKYTADAPKAYLQSHGVIEMLEKLLNKFIDQRTELEKEEMNTKHAFHMLMQDLKPQIEQATQDREEKPKVRS